MFHSGLQICYDPATDPLGEACVSGGDIGLVLPMTSVLLGAYSVTHWTLSRGGSSAAWAENTGCALATISCLATLPLTAPLGLLGVPVGLAVGSCVGVRRKMRYQRAARQGYTAVGK